MSRTVELLDRIQELWDDEGLVPVIFYFRKKS